MSLAVEECAIPITTPVESRRAQDQNGYVRARCMPAVRPLEG